MPQFIAGNILLPQLPPRHQHGSRRDNAGERVPGDYLRECCKDDNSGNQNHQ